jgi:hypothetical protein
MKENPVAAFHRLTIRYYNTAETRCYVSTKGKFTNSARKGKEGIPKEIIFELLLD